MFGAREKVPILVAIRVRPLSDRELERNDYELWRVLDENTVGTDRASGINTRVAYAYDRVFDGAATNADVYEVAGQPVVEGAISGTNGTVFAYGVTSSGKTYTMLGRPEDPGMVPRALQSVFATAEENPDFQFDLRLSMLEVYNEVLSDMLSAAGANLRLREDPARGFFAEGATELPIACVQDALGAIAAGIAQRKVGSTNFNEESSRSHTIISLSIRCRPRAAPGGGSVATQAFLNLIDLAGSESAKAATTKQHVGEGSFINKSLLALATVIAKLADGNAAHVPFRDSKLTKLLQSSLTGRGARVSIVCTVTPSAQQAEETHSTLKFATRAKKIRIATGRNEEYDDGAATARYRVEIAELRQQLAAARAAAPGYVAPDPLHPDMLSLRERLEEEHQALLKAEAEKAALEVRAGQLARFALSAVWSRSAGGPPAAGAPDAAASCCEAPEEAPEPAAPRDELCLPSTSGRTCAGELFPGRRLLQLPKAVSAAGGAPMAGGPRPAGAWGSPGGLLGARKRDRLGAAAREQELTASLQSLLAERRAVHKELHRLEAQTNQLQGYALDGLSFAQLSRLVSTLAAAVERVRTTIQLRRLAQLQPAAAALATG